MAETANRYVCGLDVGTTKVCAVIARKDLDGETAIVGTGLVPSDGLQRGVVVDRQRAIASIRRCIEIAESDSGVQVARAWVGLTGGHISSVNVTGRAYVAGPQVTQTDIDRAIDAACDSVPLTSDRRIIQYVVRDFVLDGERGIKRPLGMVARQLDVQLHVVTGRGTIVDNLAACVEEAGVRIARQVLEPPATARAVLAPAEADLGCLLVDIGGGTTDIAVYTGGSICYTSALPVGGNQVTMDLAKLLRISAEEAERVKRTYGHCLPDRVSDTEYVEVELVGTGQPEQVPRRLIAEIIEARMEEIFEAVAERISSEGLWRLTPAGAIVSGGGAELAGAPELASRLFGGLPVRLGSPRPLKGKFHQVNQPMFATGVGLALMAADEEDWCTSRAAVAADRPAKAWQTLADAWQRLTTAVAQWLRRRTR